MCVKYLKTQTKLLWENSPNRNDLACLLTLFMITGIAVTVLFFFRTLFLAATACWLYSELTKVKKQSLEDASCNQSLSAKVVDLELRERQILASKCEAEAKVSELTSEREDMEENIRFLKMQARGNYESAARAHERTMEAMKLRDEATRRTLELEVAIGDLKAKFDQLCRRTVYLEGCNNHLSGIIQERSVALVAAQDTASHIKKANQNLTLENRELKRKYQNLLSCNAELKNCKSKLESSNDKLESGIAKLETEKGKVIGDNRKLKKANKSLQHVVNKLKETLKNLEMQVEGQKYHFRHAFKEEDELAEQYDKMENSGCCSVCWINDLQIMISPCNHICLCKECNFKIKDVCPICKAQIDEKIPVFIC